jgi:hypothetical protein
VKASICVLAVALLAAPTLALTAVAPASAPARSSTKAKAPTKAKVRPAPRKAPAKRKTPANKPAKKAPAKHASHARSRVSAKAAAGQAYASGRCRLTIPKGWSDFHGGKADPRDRTFGVTIGRVADARSMTATLKAMHGRVVSDKADMTLVQVALRGRDARQYWVLTKPGPGCRATVTFADAGQEAAARKIAESLRKSR